VYCITNLLDQFATTSYVTDDGDLVHDLMAAMRSSGLWPIWPIGARTTPLQEQLAALSSLEIPIISRMYKSRSLRTTNMTSRNLICLSDKLNDLCDGLCLDCLKGFDRCDRGVLDHPDPWAMYEVQRKNVFEQRKSNPSSWHSAISFDDPRAMTPEIVVLNDDHGWN
jgi:hypothetical protein